MESSATLWKTSGTSSSYQGEYAPPPARLMRQLSLDLRAWLAKLMTERKVHCVTSVKATIPTSKLPHGLSLFALRLLDWLCFLQQEHRVQQAQGVFAPVQHFNLLHISFKFMHSYCMPRSLAQSLLVTVHSKLVVGGHKQDRTLRLRSASKYFSSSLMPAACAEILIE